MQKFLILFISLTGALSTFSCSSGSSSGGNGGGVSPQAPLAKGQGEDVGSAIANQFIENGVQPQPTSCQANSADTYQFDSRLQVGMAWEFKTEVMRPSFGSMQNTQVALTKNSNAQLSFLNRMNFAVKNGANYDLIYNTLSEIRNNQPQSSSSTTDALNQQNLEKARGLMKSTCSFQVRSADARVNRYGTFRLTDGTVVPAIYSMITNHGSWSCTDAAATRNDDAVQQIETISTYAIPDFLAQKSCAPSVIYSYSKVFGKNSNTMILESSRTELVRWMNAGNVVTPAPNPAPTPLPPVPGTP